MSEWSDRFSNDLHRSVWRFLVPWLRVPRDEPSLPATRHENAVRTFQPAVGFLTYLKFWFWIIAIATDIVFLVIWIIICVANLIVGLALLPLVLVLILLPDLIAFVAIRVRYDTTWYVMTDRALRLRRGVWVIRETTISFENVQNVSVRQGPIQRLYDISSVMIETAGSGGGGKEHTSVTNVGVIEGIDNAAEIRDLILGRVRQAPSSGLGDRDDDAEPARPQWTPQHIAALREIRDLVASAGSG